MTTARRIQLPVVATEDGERVVHDFHPAYVVWELTLKCDQPCTHCGSRAGEARPSELSTEEALRVVEQLAAMRAKEVVLIGGEAYLHPGFLEIIAALRQAGVRSMTTTGGRGIDAPRALAMAKAGLNAASVSIDGLEATHDLMRAARGSFQSATGALRHLAEAGVLIASNTNVNRLNEADLEPLYVHRPRVLRSPREQPLLSLPRPCAQGSRGPGAPRAPGGGTRYALRQRPLRARRGAVRRAR